MARIRGGRARVSVRAAATYGRNRPAPPRRAWPTSRSDASSRRVCSFAPGDPAPDFSLPGIRRPHVSAQRFPRPAGGRDRVVSQGVHRRLNGRVPVARRRATTRCADCDVQYFAASVDSPETNAEFARSLGLRVSDSERSDAGRRRAPTACCPRADSRRAGRSTSGATAAFSTSTSAGRTASRRTAADMVAPA